MVFLSLLETIISTSQVNFAVGELADGRVECYSVSLDNDVLEWSRELIVRLEITDHNQPLVLSAPNTLSLTVTDDEGIVSDRTYSR